MRKNRRAQAVIAMAVAAGMVLAGCSGQSETERDAQESESAQETETESQAAQDTPAADGQTEILVAAAASLKNAYEEELIPMFQEEHPEIIVTGTYDSSGKLQTQIEEGLEADVFMSAATAQMDALNEEGLIQTDTIVNLLENKIVLIAPASGGEDLNSFEDIVKAQSIALGDPASVPAGQYAREALTNLGLWDQIQDRVSFGTNVTEVLNQVAASSADGGIVYATDAASMPEDVRVIGEAPEGSLAEPVIYPVAVVAASAHPEEARAFVDFLQTEEVMEVFESYGFADGR